MITQEKTNKFIDRIDYWINSLTCKENIISEINNRKSLYNELSQDYISTEIIEDYDDYESSKLTINLENLQLTKMFISYNEKQDFNVYNSTNIILYNLKNIKNISNSELLIQSLEQLKMRYYRETLSQDIDQITEYSGFVHIPYELENINVIFEMEFSWAEQSESDIFFSYEELAQLIHKKSNELTEHNRELFYKLIKDKRLYKTRSRKLITF